MSPLFRLTIMLCALSWLTACGKSAIATPQKEGVVVTFRVADVEEYKIRLTDPADIEIARKLLAGEEAPRSQWHSCSGRPRRECWLYMAY